MPFSECVNVMKLSDYLVLLSAFLLFLSEVQDAYRRWRNYEPEEMILLRREMLRNGAEAERLRVDRDKWIKEVTDLHVKLEDLEKKLAHYRKQIPPAKLLEIDDSFHG